MKLITSNIKFALAGIFFGIVFVKAEIISWFRIQEMFRLESIHMYGVIGTAVATGALSVFLIRKFKIKTLQGETVVIRKKKFHRGVIIGGFLFGLGWAFTGACPGPFYVQIGSGFTVVTISLLSALLGVWTYGYLKEKWKLEGED